MMKCHFDSKITVFREFTNKAGDIMFELYRAAFEEEIENTGNYIIVDKILSPEQLWNQLTTE